jgi:hypothetical protein
MAWRSAVSSWVGWRESIVHPSQQDDTHEKHRTKRDITTDRHVHLRKCLISAHSRTRLFTSLLVPTGPFQTFPIVRGTLLVFRRQLRNRIRSYSYAFLYSFITKTTLASVALFQEPYLARIVPWWSGLNTAADQLAQSPQSQFG